MIEPNVTSLYHYESIELKAKSKDCFEDHGIKLADNIYLDRRKVEALKKRKVWYAKLETYNDPLEGMFNIADLQLNQDAINYIDNLCKLSNLDCMAEDIQKSAKPIFKGICANITEKFGFYCLSATNKDIPMWSYYASNHSGIVLEFERKSNNACGSHKTTRVKYEPEPPRVYLNKMIIGASNGRVPELSGSTESLFDELKQLLFTKTKKWDHEQEWRTTNLCGLNNMPGKLKSITIGAKTPPCVVKYLLNIEELKDVSFKYSIVCDKSYRIKITDKSTHDLHKVINALIKSNITHV